MSGISPWERSKIAALYIPVNTPDQDPYTTFSALHRDAVRRDWKILEYREKHGRSGTRPVARQMKKDGLEGKFHLLLIPSLDALAYTLEELSGWLTWLHGGNIRLIGMEDNVDLDPLTEYCRNFVHACTVLAKAESRMRVRKVRAGMVRAKNRGVHCGRPPGSFPLAEALQLKEKGLSLRAVGEKLGIPASTVADALRQAVSKKPPELEGPG